MKKSLAVANNLKYYRKKFGMTQEQLSEQLNMERSNYACYETGRMIPPLKKIIQIAKLFNINCTDLIDEYCEELSRECECEE